MAITLQIFIEGHLIHCEVLERVSARLVLDNPQRAMRHQRVLVHEKRKRIRNSPAQTVENPEPMCVDITPIEDEAVSQPWNFREAINGVPSAVRDHSSRELRERQEICLIQIG